MAERCLLDFVAFEFEFESEFEVEGCRNDDEDRCVVHAVRHSELIATTPSKGAEKERRSGR